MTLTAAELSALRPPERLPISDWIEKNRVLHESYAAEPGPKRIDRTPFVRPILDAWLDPWVREIVVCKSAQIGLTDLAIDLVGHTAANDPSPMAIFLADQTTAEKVMVDRVHTMLRSTACLKAFMDDNRITKGEAYLRNGFNLTCSWASSIAQTASRPFKHLILDEINKPGYSATGEEGSALGRLRQRQETFADSKLLMMSTPTGEDGNVTREMASCDAVYDWCVPCPKCGSFQPLRWTPQAVGDRKSGGVVWDGGMAATLDQIEATARYQCGECSELWTTTEKNAAVLLGQPIPRSTAPSISRRVGFQLNRIMSLFPGGRLEKLVLDFIESKKNLMDFQNFINSALGDPWIQRVSRPQNESQEIVLSCRSECPKGVVPEDAVALVCAIDTQNDGYWYRVRAFAQDKTSWGIEEGFLAGEHELETILFSTTWKTQSGRALRIWRSLIDTGGGKEDGALISRTEEVYDFIRRNRRRGVQFFGAKGSSRSMATKIKIGSPIEKMPSGKPIPGGLQIVFVNTDVMKDELWHRIERSKNQEPGAWYLHAETPEWVAMHITAEERRIVKGVNEWTQIRKDNHMLDCECLCLAAADPEFWGGVRVLRKQIPQKPQETEEQLPQPRRQVQTAPRSENPWTKGIVR